MATTKKKAIETLKPVPQKNAAKTSAPAPQKKAASKALVKSPPVKRNKEKSGDELVVDNLAELSKVVTTLSTTLDMLVEKAESMAHHIIASEAVLAELVAANGLNLARVNSRIRIKIAAGTESYGNANQAIDAAAAIASPLPRR